MNHKTALIGLGGLNAILLGVVVWQAVQLRNAHELQNQPGLESAASQSADDASRASSDHDTRELAAASIALPPAARTNLSPSALNRAVFDWQQIESPDYQTYIQNLRRIGCPEQTIRDIVAADVVQAYRARREEIAAKVYRDFKYWDPAVQATDRRDEFQRQRRELDEEAGKTIGQLLGGDVVPPDTAREWQAVVLEQQLSFLPAEKREAVRNALLRAASNEADMIALARNRPPTGNADELRRIADTYDAGQGEFLRILTPGEYEQLQMSVSWTANNVRERLAQFHPTEQEYQMIFHEWWEHDNNLAKLRAFRSPDPGNLHTLVNERIKEKLGDKRYEDYAKSWKP